MYVLIGINGLTTERTSSVLARTRLACQPLRMQHLWLYLKTMMKRSLMKWITIKCLPIVRTSCVARAGPDGLISQSPWYATPTPTSVLMLNTRGMLSAVCMYVALLCVCVCVFVCVCVHACVCLWKVTFNEHLINCLTGLMLRLLATC